MSSRFAAALAVILALAACRNEKPLTTNLNVENKVAMRGVSLFYAGPATLLVAEQRSVALPENPAAALPIVLRELIKGSANAGVASLFPNETAIRGAYLLPEGTAVVDMGGPAFSDGWTTGTHQELMAIQSIVQTVVTNFPETRRVRILVNGTPSETFAGHISLGGAFAPVPSMVQK